MSWLLVVVAVVLLLVLTYFMTLTTRPEISQINPAPNSNQAPGPVQLGAVITSQRDLEEVIVTVDDLPIDVDVERIGDAQWRVLFEDVFERGERRVHLEVSDRNGRTAQHDWIFESAGELTPPRLMLETPPSNAMLPAGPGGLKIQATTFADIGSVRVEVDGEPVDHQIEQSGGEDSEYSAGDGMPIYEWTITARTEFPPGTFDVALFLVDEYGVESSGAWNLQSTLIQSEATARFFPETSQYAEEPFLAFWIEHGGAPIFGPPVSPKLINEEGIVQQFFRYARFELGEDEQVQLTLIGREVFGPPEPPPGRPPTSGSRLFDATGHYIYGPIREYWEQNGGIRIFGYPISGEFETQNGYAQFFERALIEVDETTASPQVRKVPLGEQLYQELRQSGQSTPAGGQ